MEQPDSRPRFKLVHVVMPRLWYVKFKQIRRSYRRKRPAAAAAGGTAHHEPSFSSSCDGDTSFQSSSSCEPSFHLHPHQHFRPIDAARSLIDVAFPLSPNLASSAHRCSPLRYAVSPASPSSRFYPSPCRFGNHLPPPPTASSFPPKAIDISYPISPRKPPPPLVSPSPAATFLSHRNVDFLLSSATARGPPPPLLRSRSVRSSLFACFSDDFKLPPASQLDPSCTCTPASSHDYCHACRTGRALSSSSASASWRSSSARPSTHRRGLSLGCISNTRSGSPEASAMPAYQDASEHTSEWERETSWTVLAEFDNEVVTRRVVLRKRVPANSSSGPGPGPGHRLRLPAGPGLSPSSSKFLEGAGRQKKGEATEVDNFRLSTSSGDVNAEHNAVPWDKDFSSATSEDPESLFTSFEGDSACVTPPRPPPLMLSAFQASRAAHASSSNNFVSKVTPPGGSSAAAAAAGWGPSFIPQQECQVGGCSSPDTHATTATDHLLQRQPHHQPSEASDTPGDYDTEASIPSSYGTRHRRCALEDESEPEMLPLQRRTRLAPLQECQASSLLSSLRDPSMSPAAQHTRGTSDLLSPRFLECSSSTGTCTDEDDMEEEEEEQEQEQRGLASRQGVQSLESRHFPSSEDEIAAFNEMEPNGRRLVVSDESPEREEQYSRARTQARESRRKGARCKRNDVASGKRVDRKSALRTVDRAHCTKEAQATPVNLPAEIRGKVRESVPVVTRSYDPYRDFRDSMLEMILEKDILETQDLEELLHAYLALNEGEFHGLIVEVFTDLWYHMFDAETSRL